MSKVLNPETPVRGRDYVSVTAGDEQVVNMLAFIMFRKIKKILKEQEQNRTPLQIGKALGKEERRDNGC